MKSDAVLMVVYSKQSNKHNGYNGYFICLFLFLMTFVLIKCIFDQQQWYHEVDFVYFVICAHCQLKLCWSWVLLKLCAVTNQYPTVISCFHLQFQPGREHLMS